MFTHGYEPTSLVVKLGNPIRVMASEWLAKDEGEKKGSTPSRDI